MSSEAADFSVRLYGFKPGFETSVWVREVAPVRYSGQPSGRFDDVRNEDGQVYLIRSGQGLRLNRYHTASAIFDCEPPVYPLQSMRLKVVSQANKPGVRQELAMYDFIAQRWEVLDDRPLGVNQDLTVILGPLPDPTRFFGPAGLMRTRVEAYAGAAALSPFELRVNQVAPLVAYLGL